MSWGHYQLTLILHSDLIAATKYQEAKQLFAQMKAEGPKPNLPTFNIMTNLFKAENDFPALQQLQDEMAAAFKKTKKNLSKSLEPEEGEVKRSKPLRQYRPAYRTGPNALLRALLTAPNAKAGLGKDDLISFAQPFCDVSFSVPSDYNGFYTAWNSMSSLIQKGLVQKSGGVRSSESEMGLTYQLTEAGEALASELNSEAQAIEQGKAKPPQQPKRSVSAIAHGAGSTSAANSEASKVAAEADS
eukprot:TRINITY_DN1023_c0_g1_i1.p1 TRINITY_DN1023_c0_g1~~TRINITY_DN1023_c0_g1_i1.p1  ORF type:complete len:244 (-),score=44.56 TRINITY_DN1023_c0_g1_i1:248-979(-)